MNARTAITGFGCVTGYGIGRERLWNGLLSASPATRADGAARLATRAPGLDDLIAESSRPAGPSPSRTSVMASIAAREAIEGSALAGIEDRERVGILMNRNFGQHAIVSRYYETLWDKGPSAVSGLAFVQTIANSVLGQIALEHRLRGPSVLAFGSSLLTTAIDVLRDGEADALVVGAVDELSDLALAICDAYGMTVGARGVEPMPSVYDDRHTGFHPGDGAAFLVIESEASALRRNANVLAWIRDCGSTLSLGSEESPLGRKPEEIEQALRAACEASEAEPHSIDVITVSASGLPDYDEAELEAISAAGARPRMITAPKAALGETWSTAALLSAGTTALMLRERVVVPTAQFGDAAARFGFELSRTPVPDDALRLAASVSLDASGANDVVILESVA